MAKEYVEVDAYFDTLGNITPVAFWWNNKQYEVDKVIDVRRAASILAGDLGLCYTCRILGKERRIWFDDYNGKWFVEVADKKQAGICNTGRSQ